MALAITSYAPLTGPVGGGTLVTITGTDLDDVDLVFVGNKQANIVDQDATELRFYTPAGAAVGTAELTVVDTTTDPDTSASAATDFTYTAVTASETLISTLARKFRVDVDLSAAQDGSEYVQIRGIRDLQPTVDPTMQDDSDYDSDGWGSDVKTMLKWKLVMKLARKVGIGSGAYDPGQEAIRAAHDKFGLDGVVRVRWYDRTGGPEAYEGFAQVQWSEDGGDTAQLSSASVTLVGQGVREEIANPA